MKTRQIQFAILILILSSVAVCALIAVRRTSASRNALVATPTTGSAAATEVYEGMVTCSRCGARHSIEMGRSAAECTRICVRDGAGLALVDGDKTYTLQIQPYALRNVIGQRARISGVASGNTIRVVSVLPPNR